MARYTGPKSRIARKFGEPIFGEDKVLARRNFPPGQHGNNKRRKLSEYGTQLKEKQKAKYTYGVLEKQFRNLFNKAAHKEGITGELLLQMLECRLDNIVYRMGLSRTRSGARQLVNHGHILVDGNKVDIPSYRVKIGDVISLKEDDKNLKVVAESLAKVSKRVEFVTFDDKKLEGKFVRLPERNELNADIKETLIVEFYNR